MLIHVFRFLQGGPSWRDNAGRTIGFRDCTCTCFPFVSTSHQIKYIEIVWCPPIHTWAICTISVLWECKVIQRPRCCVQKVYQASRGQPCLPSNSPAPRGDLHFVGYQWRLRVPSSLRDRRIAAMTGLLSWNACKIWESNFVGLKVGFCFFSVQCLRNSLRHLQWRPSCSLLRQFFWAFLCLERGCNKHTYSCIHQLFSTSFSLTLSLSLSLSISRTWICLPQSTAYL